MCFEPTSRPPSPPWSGHLQASDRLTIESADGTAVAARLATSDAAGAPGIVVLPDVRGLHAYYEALADELAHAGVHALAIDLYARTAGVGYRDESFDIGPHRAAATDAGLGTDVDAALAHLRALGAKQTFVLGFCFGGRGAFMQASKPEVAGVVGFYGWPAREQDGASPVQQARDGLAMAPVLALYGGADEKITRDDIAAFHGALAAAGVPHDSVVYPGAPHSFFDRKMDEHAEACHDAWARMLDFFGVEPTGRTGED
jgi:carboxymethylenebutenolidase